MIRIGDFARLSRVSVKTLRHYDELGLIKPVRVDEFSSYRYYNLEQYPLMSRIRALKDLGFSLEEIGRLIREGLSGPQMQAMLRLRSAEIRQRIRDEEGRLARVEAWQKQLEREEDMTQYEVVVKRVPVIKTANVRGVVPQPADQGPLWRDLFSYLEEQQVSPSGPVMSLYYDEEPPDHDWDIEASAPIDAKLKENGKVTIRELPAVETMASVLHAAPFITINEAYATLWAWAGENGYRVAGPPREVIIRPPKMEGEGASQTDPDTVVEVQFPLEKIGA